MELNVVLSISDEAEMVAGETVCGFLSSVEYGVYQMRWIRSFRTTYRTVCVQTTRRMEEILISPGQGEMFLRNARNGCDNYHIYSHVYTTLLTIYVLYSIYYSTRKEFFLFATSQKCFLAIIIAKKYENKSYSWTFPPPVPVQPFPPNPCVDSIFSVLKLPCPGEQGKYRDEYLFQYPTVSNKDFMMVFNYDACGSISIGIRDVIKYSNSK